jgi:hypothetical protein
VVLQYPLRSYCNFEVGHLHGNGTLETEVHDSGIDVRIQGWAAPLTSCENNVRQCITLDIMKALEFDVDLLCTSVKQYDTRTAVDTVQLRKPLAYDKVTLTKDPRYKVKYFGVSLRIHALHSRTSVRTYLKTDLPAQNSLLVPQCWCVTGSCTLFAIRSMRTVYVIVDARS